MGLLAAFRRPGFLLLLPALLALAARVLVAPGWMIDADSGGSITVRICSDPENPGTTLTIPIEKTGDHEAAQSEHCPWGALAVAPVVPDTPALAERPTGLPLPPSAVPTLGFAPGIASPLPPSTGPPALA
ncbi:hypothetical protein [Sphingopyxis flava]|uniref:DUF2946 domain-containing protein n=1 Tax=Sphingopyxis flava TaxID=1507287 RepID=A0A1T5E2H3_9SPHN|nr:hypothetical protein [Sphingopyxis flava]SKB78104.1 hypothetical protein SAMN06295937_101834 [Sphingopyxis flava]